MKRLDDCQIQEIIKMYNQGFSPKEIGKKFEIFNNSVTRILKNHGVERNQSSKMISEETQKTIILRYKNLETSAKIAKDLDINSSTVYRILKKNNIEIRPPSSRKENLLNQKFNKLLVIDFALNVGKRPAWICQCDCGNTKIIKSEELKSGGTKSCGCLNIEQRSNRAEKMYSVNIKYHPATTSARRVWRRRYNDGISFEDFYHLSQQKCFYCDDPPSNIANAAKEDPKSSQYAKDEGNFIYNGLDRIDNNKTHTIDNVVSCCKWCNISKRDRTIEEFKEWLQKIYAKFGNLNSNVSIKKENLYTKIVEVNGQPITTTYVKSLNKEQRLDLVNPIFQYFRELGWQYPDDSSTLEKSWKKLCEFKPDLSVNEISNNSSLATDICKYFCHKFYDATQIGSVNMKDVFYNDEKLKELIKNRLGLSWYDDPNNNETFNICFRMLIQGMRSSRATSVISMFKPSIAKYMYMKYSNDGDIVYDYSIGWGGRMLGAASCNRQYIGTDPWTSDEVNKIVEKFNLKNITLINDGSENVKLKENSIDFSFSSPPYYNQEIYSNDSKQAYNNGEDYFYNQYWRKTLENVKFMLKPEKWFGLNLSNYPKMLNIAIEYFGEPIEEIKLKTLRSHLTYGAGKIKYEPIYMFKNNK